MGDDSGSEDQVARAVANNLVGDAEVAAAGVARVVRQARIYEHPSGIVKLESGLRRLGDGFSRRELTLDKLSPLHYNVEIGAILQHSNVLHRIDIDDQQVSELAGFDCPEIVLHAE